MLGFYSVLPVINILQSCSLEACYLISSYFFLICLISLSPYQLATWDSTRGLNGSLKENRIESGMHGVTLKIVTLLVSCGSTANLLTLELRRQISEKETPNYKQTHLLVFSFYPQIKHQCFCRTHTSTVLLHFFQIFIH